MYILLTGAKKNIGDFLILDRSRALIRHERPDRELNELESWKPLNSNLTQINKSQAIIIVGGPGYQPEMYPKIYPLVKELSAIKVPIIPMALGWKGFPGDELSFINYRLSTHSIELLKKIHENCAFSSCRDYLTQRLLARYGFKNIIMTGCSVWYDLNYIGKQFMPPKKLDKIAVTPPQRSLYRKQFIKILKQLRKIFPNVEIVCFFHRGIRQDNYTNKCDFRNIEQIIMECKEMGLPFEDMAYDLSKLKIYDEFDIHLGYRLHGHLIFLSKRKPSFLINEDGRGRGAQEALGLLSINGFKRSTINQIIEEIFSHGLNKYSLSAKLSRPILIENDSTINNIIAFLKEELDNGFERFYGVFHVIDNHYKKMRQFLQSLP